MCRSEKTASGMARVSESSQMVHTLKQMVSRALDLWLSRGWTMALYLDRKTHGNNSSASGDHITDLVTYLPLDEEF